METGDFQFEALAQRLREMAYLNRGVTIKIVDEREGQEQEQTFYFDGGLRSFVRHLNKNRNVVMARPVYIEKRRSRRRWSRSRSSTTMATARRFSRSPMASIPLTAARM